MKTDEKMLSEYMANITEHNDIIDPKKFLLPDMGDFLGDEMSIEYSEMIRDHITNEKGEGIKIDSAFFLEKPYTTNLGYDEENSTLVIKPGKMYLDNTRENMNIVDGDTIYIDIDSIVDGDESFTHEGYNYSRGREYIRESKGILGIESIDKDHNKLGIRFLGIDAPELPKYSMVPYSTTYKTMKVKNSEIESLNSNFKYTINKKRQKDGYTTFLTLDNGDTWFEIFSRKQNDYVITVSDNSKKDDEYARQAEKARDKVVEILKKADDVRIILDMNTLSLNGMVPEEYSDSVFYDPNTKSLSKIPNIIHKAINKISKYRENMYSGYNAFGMDNYRRMLGAIYVKLPRSGDNYAGEWINLAKLVAYENDKVELLPDYTNNPYDQSKYGFVSNAFKMWTYNPNQKIVDALQDISSLDDRKKIHEQIFGTSFDNLMSWTVSIGDCLFLVPPTSIKLAVGMTNERTPLIRSRGSAAKSAKKDSRVLQLDLYFNEERGINGYPVNVELPGREVRDGKEQNIQQIYYMNGLRSLVSMFKFTPFLPIENHYINRELNIEAVSLISMSVSSVPSMPRTLKATIMLQEFDYRVYMPEIPIPEMAEGTVEELNKNMFSNTINYQLMRYYYQRPILRGEKLKNVPMNSDEYIKRTLGDQTALQPMRFKNPYIEFYRIDEEFLKRKQQAYTERERRGLRHLYDVSNEMLRYREHSLAPFFNELNKALDNIENNYYKIERIDSLDDDIHLTTKNSILRHLKNVAGGGISNKITGLGKDTKIKYPKKGVEIENLSVLIDLPRGDARPSERDKVYKNYCEELNIPKDSFSRNKFRVDLETKIVGDRLYFTYKTGTDHDKLLMLVMDQQRRNDYKTPIEKQQTHLLDKVHDIDFETPDSLKFIKIETEPIIVTGYTTIMSNNFNNISLQMSNGYAPQYLGGQDIRFDIQIETTNEEVVTMLAALPRDIATTCREYRDILTVYPVRVDTEFTKFFGVNEVMIENVEVDTESAPEGVLKKHWKINMTLISVDRTIRNRERLKNIDKRKNHGGKTGLNQSTVTSKNYWDLKDTLAKAEVYPDLELPTIDELERVGFKFIRYSNSSSNRVYPDPDFYFYYGHLMANEIFRTSITTFLNENNEKASYEMTDSTGAKIKIDYDDNDPRSYKVTHQNDIYKEALSYAEKIEEIKKEIREMSLRERNTMLHLESSNYLHKMLESLYRASSGDTWNISDEILVKFREKYLNDELKTEKINDDNITKQLNDRSRSAIKNLNLLLNKKPKFIKGKEGKAQSILKGNRLNSQISDFKSSYNTGDIRKHCKKNYGRFRMTDEGAKIIKDLNLFTEQILYAQDTMSKELKLPQAIPGLIASIAAARTGIYEFDGFDESDYEHIFDKLLNKKIIRKKKRYPDWSGQLPYYCLVRDGTQDMTSVKEANTLLEAVSKGFLFSAFGIETYTAKEIQEITGEKPITKRDRYFIDPYYRNYATDEEIRRLKVLLLTDESVAAEMAFRELLFWFKKLLDRRVIFSMFDLMKNEILSKVDKMTSLEGTLYGKFRSRSKHVSKFLLKDEIYIGNINDEKTQESLKQIKSLDDQYIESEFLSNVAESIKVGMDRISIFYRDKLKGEDVTEDRKELEEKLNKREETKEIRKEVDEEIERLTKDLNELRTTLVRDAARFEIGKFFVAGLMAATNGNKDLIDLVMKRDYDTLNSMTLDAANTLSGNGDYEEETMKFIKYIRGLAGYGLVPNPERIGQKPRTSNSQMVNNTMSRIYIKAAEQPLIYLRHSFYDMIVNDKRGRMVRAFPTFYMLFLDEGREIGWWKLHDNFYNMNSISSFQVVKSRKIAADTATIVMNNMFQTFDRYDDDLKTDDEYTVMDYFTSIMSPRMYYIEEEIRRLQQRPVSRFMMKPGIRTHVRMGYGSNASTLPIVFNGTITEVEQGDVIQLVAQGDGVELTNAITFNADAEDVKHYDKIPGWRFLNNFFTRGATPKEILTSLMLTDGGPFRSTVRKITKDRLFNDNPLGIVHFGDKRYDDIFPEGEIVQNIYEATSKPSWGEKGKSRMAEEYELKDAPKISIDIFEKTFWDIMHICSSVSPDYVSGVRNFGFRSTVFHGRPRYYYAYEYEKTKDNVIVEKRKPFQQYHIYTSYSDIIENNIVASEKGLSTCAVGMYDKSGFFGMEKIEKLNPVWVDINIYPEKQKTITVDTQILFKGIPIISDIIPYFTHFQGRIADIEGKVQGGHNLAWRAVANTLKMNMADMYKGSILIIGDPSVDPHDRFVISDIYEKMTGTMGVEAVIHNFSIQTGFVTEVYPDLITTVDDPHENMIHNLVHDTTVKGIGVFLTHSIMSQLFAGSTKPILTSFGTMIKKGAMGGDSFMFSFLNIASKSGIDGENIVRKMVGLEDFLGIPSLASTFDAFDYNGVNDAIKVSKKIADMDMSKMDIGDTLRAYSELNNVMKRGDATILIEELEKVKAADKNVKEVNEILNKLNSYNKVYGENLKPFLNIYKTDDINGIKHMLEMTAKLDNQKYDFAKDASKMLDKIKDIKTINNSEDLNLIIDSVNKLERWKHKGPDFYHQTMIEMMDMVQDSTKINLRNLSNMDDVAKFTSKVTQTGDAIAPEINKIDKFKFALENSDIVPSLVYMVAKYIVIKVAIGTITSNFERMLKSYQTLQVFPVMKNGKVLTAGMEGSKGVIVGSPMYNEKGLVDGFIGKLYDTNQWKGFGKIIPTVVNILSSEGMREAASKYIDNEIVNNSEETLEFDNVKRMMDYLAAEEMKEVNAYHAAVITPRLKSYVDRKGKLTEEGRVWFHKAGVLSTKNIEKNHIIKDGTIYLKEYPLLKEHFDSGDLILAHDKSDHRRIRQINVQGENINMNCIEKNGTIDLPVLRKDPILLLNEIVSKVKERTSSSSIAHNNKKKVGPLVVQSALVAGIRNIKSTGMSFTITATNMEDFEKVLMDLTMEQEALFEKKAQGELRFFNYKKMNNDKTTFLIEVMPPYTINDVEEYGKGMITSYPKKKEVK